MSAIDNKNIKKYAPSYAGQENNNNLEKTYGLRRAHYIFGGLLGGLLSMPLMNGMHGTIGKALAIQASSRSAPKRSKNINQIQTPSAQSDDFQNVSCANDDNDVKSEMGSDKSDTENLNLNNQDSSDYLNINTTNGFVQEINDNDTGLPENKISQKL